MQIYDIHSNKISTIGSVESAATKPYALSPSIKLELKEAFVKGGEGSLEVFLEQLAHLKVDEPEMLFDMIIEKLMKLGFVKTLKAFILNHNQRYKTEPQDRSVSCKQTVEEYISLQDWRIKANANTDYSNAGLINNSAGKIIANYWLDSVYSLEEGVAHRNADYHIHDLDHLTGYCAGWSLRILLDEGFNGVVGKVSSRPPKHFREALGQMANFLGILQAEWRELRHLVHLILI
jgi:ribonucleoside-triphosphate reductase